MAETITSAEIVEHFLGGSLPVCFVIDDQRRLRGEISIHDVKALFQEQPLGALVIAGDLCHPCLATVTEDDTLARCLELLVSTEQEYLPVVATDSGVLQGIVSYRDLLQLYNREILHPEYLGLDLRIKGQATVRGDLQLPHDYTVTILRVPEWCVGSTLRTLQLRTQFNLTVVAIRQGGKGHHDSLPDPNDVLSVHDYLVVVGHAESIREFQKGVPIRFSS